MKNKWNKIKNLSIMELASIFKEKKPELSDWHKEKIEQHANFIAEGGILTFRNRRRK